MKPTELRSLITQCVEEGVLAPSPPVASGGPTRDGGHSPLGVVADLVVDLAEALERARKIGLEVLDIYADTLVVPAGFNQRLDGLLRRLSIVTRRIVANGSTALRMVHDEHNRNSMVRIFVGSIEGDFGLFGGPDGNVDYDVASAADISHTSQFSNFLWQEQTTAIKSTAIPAGLLAYGEPLHRVLVSQFGLSAALVGKSAPRADELALSHACLAWITQWSGVQTEFGELVRVAEALKALIPVINSGVSAKPIPGLTTERYLDLAKVQKDVMVAMESTLGNLAISTDLSRVVERVVTAFSGRDTDELGKLEAQRSELESRLSQQIDALDKASRTLSQEEFDAEIASMRLDLENKIARVKRFVKLSFEIAFALVKLGSDIAALCVGAPADSTAATQKGVDGVKGVAEMFKEAGKLGRDIRGPLDALKALCQSFSIPLKWAKDNSSTLKEFGDPARSVLRAILPVLNGPLGGFDTAAASKELGDAMRKLATVPDANEAKAAWLVLEIDIVNQLDMVLREPDLETDVKRAANEFKTRVQRVAIYGRLLAEQSSAKAAIAGQLAALKLEYLAVIAKRQRLETLGKRTLNDAARKERIRAEMVMRSESAARGFFVASYGARAAQAYETWSQPTNRLRMLTSASGMADAHAVMLADYENADAANTKHEGEFTRPLLVNDAALLEKLSRGQPVSFDLDTNNPTLKNYKRLRLVSVQAWLEFPSARPRRVAVQLVTGATFRDRGDREIEHFFAVPQRISFEYAGKQIEFSQRLRGVLPTPFTTWLIEIVEPNPLPERVQGLRIVMTGKGAIK
jgi:hypothetical protein